MLKIFRSPAPSVEALERQLDEARADAERKRDAHASAALAALGASEADRKRLVKQSEEVAAALQVALRRVQDLEAAQRAAARRDADQAAAEAQRLKDETAEKQRAAFLAAASAFERMDEATAALGAAGKEAQAAVEAFAKVSSATLAGALFRDATLVVAVAVGEQLGDFYPGFRRGSLMDRVNRSVRAQIPSLDDFDDARRREVGSRKSAA